MVKDQSKRACELGVRAANKICFGFAALFPSRLTRLSSHVFVCGEGSRLFLCLVTASELLVAVNGLLNFA